MDELENYDAKNISLLLREKMLLGRDYLVKNIGGYELKSDCVYRPVKGTL